jgi:transposase
LLEGVIGVFVSPAEKRGGEPGPSTKDMQAKIGQLTLENDFLEVALGRVGDASAKR